MDCGLYVGLGGNGERERQWPGEGGDAGEVQGGPRECVEPDRGQTGVLEFGALAMEPSL